MTSRPDPPDHTGDRLWWARSDSRLVMALDRAGCAVLRRLPEGPRRERSTRSWRALVHRGDGVHCPVCDGRYRHFGHRWNTMGVVCWRCGSHERHRLLWLFLTRLRPALLAEARSLLHFAPEPGLESRLRARGSLDYVSCDLDASAAELAIDITAIDLPDESFDAMLCSHVLEHVPDDAAAMRELHRVLRSGGWCIVVTPLDARLPRTDEDPAVSDPRERRRRFWQEDHVPLYGPDLADRLRAAGFSVEELRPAGQLSSAEIERYRVGDSSGWFLCRKPRTAR